MQTKGILILTILIAIVISCSANGIEIVGKWAIANPSKDFRGIQTFTVSKARDTYTIRIMGLKDFPLSYDSVAGGYTFRILGLGPDGEPEKLVPNGKMLIHYVLVDSKWKEDGKYARVID